MIAVLLDPRALRDDTRLVTVRYENRWTQIFMNEDSARALAQVLGVELTICKPGTTIPAKD